MATVIPASAAGNNVSDVGSGSKSQPTSQLDANVYATKKTIAQGLLDVALLTSNASQLKYLLQAGPEHEFYYVMMVLISLSIILQMCIGVALILKGRRDINEETQQPLATKLNDLLVWLVFASTVVHIFLSVFVIQPGQQLPFPASFFEGLNASLSTS